MCTECSNNSTFDCYHVHPIDTTAKEDYFGYYKSWACTEEDHVFVWTSTGTSASPWPTQKCMCGCYTWKQYCDRDKIKITVE